MYAIFKTLSFFRGRSILGADAEYFTTVGPGETKGRDKNFEYKLGKRVDRKK